MPKFPNPELSELFFLEVDSYLPEIRRSLEELSADRSALTAVQELHRLFHNIKGAASQVRLTDLSGGARVVESALDEVLEGQRALSNQLLEAVKSVTDLLVEFSSDENHSKITEHNFHRQTMLLFADDLGSGEVEEPQSYLQDVQSILPLLQQLAGCLSEDGNSSDQDRSVYGKLSHAVSVLSSTFFAAGRREPGDLMQDFHLLLEKLHKAEIPHRQEMAGLMQDFLGFLELSFSSEELNSSVAIEKVKTQFLKFKAILIALGQREESPVQTVQSEVTSIFEDLSPDGDSMDFLDEIGDANIFEMEPEEPESSVEPVDEDQQLLMDIFREECDEHLIVINQSLNILERDVKESTVLTDQLLASVSDMRRAVHTLKGAASMTGVNLLAKGAHSLEDMLDWLHDEAGQIHPREVQVIATGIDVIELLSQTPQATESENLDKLVATIDHYLASRSEEVGSKEDEGAEKQEEEGIAEEPVIEESIAEELVAASIVAKDDLPTEPVAVDPAPAALPGDVGSLRVRLEDLDELVSIEGELVVARGAMEKMVEEFSRTLVELENVKENLRRKSQELESGFEVQSLYGFNPAGRQGGVDGPVDSDLADFDPIELDRYSQLNLIIRSLNEISVDVNAIHSTLATVAGDISGQVGKQQLTMRLMQDKLMRIRMTPLSSISRVLFRTVRDTAAKLGKKVALTISGEDVYMDRFVWARITDPLMHILRNGVDHGIESAEIREGKGKPETATINLQAEQRSRYVVLRISDDGGGIDFPLIRDKIKREGLAEQPESLSEKELLEFLFHPSFTTRQNITTISGRGVGLDVVRRNIQDLRGSIEIHNSPGQGVEFEIQIPFTLSVNRAAMVLVAGREYAIPLQDITQVKHFTAEEIEDKDGLCLRFGEGLVPVSNLGYHLQLEQKLDSVAPGSEGLLAVLFMRGEELCAVAVDSVTEQREIIVKNLGSHLTHVQGISGVTLTGAGGMIPILNLAELVTLHTEDEISEGAPLLQMDLQEPLKVLIVDDSISVRHSVARLVESQSWQQLQAVDGLDALSKLENFSPDVIILDIEMPRMNGYEFKSSLNNQPMYKDIPVVMLTSRASEKHQQKARELGVKHYLTKPYQDETFIQLLENIRTGS